MKNDETKINSIEYRCRAMHCISIGTCRVYDGVLIMKNISFQPYCITNVSFNVLPVIYNR